MKKIILLFMIISILPITKTFSQCAQTSNIYTFTYGGHTYEVVKEMKSWAQASACAVERGGYLVEINDANEQNAIYNAIINGAGVSTTYTSVANGGGIAYIWIGATDQNSEGIWLWDGNNDNNGINFWTGLGVNGSGNGSVVNGLYVNWGGTSSGTQNEPDNFGSGQNHAAIGLAGWPSGTTMLGVPGEWNDIIGSSSLYYVIEKSNVAINESDLLLPIRLFPNPSQNTITIQTKSFEKLKLTIYNAIGNLVLSEIEVVNEEIINIQNLEVGIYFYIFRNNQGFYQSGKFIKQ